MLFALALVSIYGPSMAILIAIITISMAPGYFRVVRNQAFVLRNADYVVAAKAMGASRIRIAASHLLPNLIGPLLVLIAMDIPAVIGMPPEMVHDQPAFGPAIHACPGPSEVLMSGAISRTVHQDLAGGNGGHSYSVLPHDGASAKARFFSVQRYARDDLNWKVRLETSSEVWWEDGKMLLASQYEAFEGEEKVFAATGCIASIIERAAGGMHPAANTSP